MFKQIFVNLPIENLKKSVGFFGELGFTFNEQFSDEESTCMIVSEHIYVMLLEKRKFSSFTSKRLPTETRLRQCWVSPVLRLTKFVFFRRRLSHLELSA